MNELEQVGILSLFPTPVDVTNIGRSFTKLEMQCIADIPMQKLEKQDMSNHQSVNLTLFEEFPNLKDIKKFIENQLVRFLKEIEGVDTDLAGLRITQSWLNKNKPDEWHPIHHHANSYLSGVLYINCLPNDGIVFNNRFQNLFNNMEFPKKKNTIWSTTNIEHPVKEGDLILLPSWVPHEVFPNKTKNKERITLAFNTFPVGEMSRDSGADHTIL